MPDVLNQTDKEADLIEVIMMDLGVLQDKVEDRQSGNATADEEVLLKSIYNVPNAIKMMEELYQVDLTGYKEGVNSKMSLLDIIEKQKNELEEQKNELEEQKNELERQKREIKEKDSENEHLKKIIAELQSKIQLSQA